MRRLTSLPAVACLVLAAVTGCGQVSVDGLGSGSAGASFEDRAEQVAATWAKSSTSTAWKTGLVVMQDLTIEPPNGFPSGEMKEAFAAGIYRSLFPLPQDEGTGRVTFAGGEAPMSVPVLSAQAAYQVLHRGDPSCTGPQPSIPPMPRDTAPPDSVPPGSKSPGSTPPVSTPDARSPQATAPSSVAGSDGVSVSPVQPGLCSPLQISKATLKTAELRTSRGTATVPAWHFTVVGLKEPVVRVALDDRVLTERPELPRPVAPAPNTVSVQSLDSAEGSEVDFTLGVGSCDKDIRARSWENADVVVVGGTIAEPPADQACDASLKLVPVTVQLKAPLGDRVVLDAATGQPLILGQA